MSTLFVCKGKDSQHHLIGHFSNRWRDHDFHSAPEQGGEIIASGAHKEFEQWLDKNRQHAPELWIWHAYGSALKSRGEWWGWSGNFFWMSWPLTEKEANSINEWAGEEDLGMSFGFYSLKYDNRDAVIERYRAFEASILPREAAANKWTGISLVEDRFKGENMFSEGKMQALRRFFGEDKVKAMIEDDTKLAQILDEAGIDSKELGAEVEEGAGTVVPEAKAEDEVAEAKTPVAAPVADQSAIEEQVVEALKRLESALGGDIQKLAEKLVEVEAKLILTQQKLATVEEREEADAKAAAMPPSILTAYVPLSILDSGEVGKSSAVIDGRSSLAKAGPAAPEGTSNNYASKLLGI